MAKVKNLKWQQRLFSQKAAIFQERIDQEIQKNKGRIERGKAPDHKWLNHWRDCLAQNEF